MARKLHDWVAISTDYIQGWIDPETGQRKWPTFKDLAEKYDIKPATIGSRSSREKWQEQRQQFIQTAMERAYQDGVDARAEEIVKMDQQHDLLAKNLIVFIDQWVRSHAKRDINGRVIVEKINPDELSKVTSSLQRLQAIQRTAMGLPTTNPPGLMRHQLNVEGSLKVSSDPVAQVFMLIQEMDENALQSFISKLESQIGSGATAKPGKNRSGGSEE